jgi:polyhydroxyalkanoate synthesis regulator phasin
MEFGMIVSFVLKLVEWLLDRSKLNKEQAKALLEIIKESQSQPVSSVRIKKIISDAEEDIRRQEKELKDALP